MSIGNLPSVLFGVPEKIKPLKTNIPGRIRFRFRNNGFGWVFIKTTTGIRQFAIGIKDDHWFPIHEQARNERREES